MEATNDSSTRFSGRIRQRRAFDQLGQDLLHPLRIRRHTAHSDRDRRLGQDVRRGSRACRVDAEVEAPVSRENRVLPIERDRTPVAR